MEKEKQIQDAMIELLIDTNEENKKIMKRQNAVIVLLICLLFASFCYYVYSFNQFDYEDTITTSTSNNAQSYDKNNTINAHINDININAKDKK